LLTHQFQALLKDRLWMDHDLRAVDLICFTTLRAVHLTPRHTLLDFCHPRGQDVLTQQELPDLLDYLLAPGFNCYLPRQAQWLSHAH